MLEKLSPRQRHYALVSLVLLLLAIVSGAKGFAGNPKSVGSNYEECALLKQEILNSVITVKSAPTEELDPRVPVYLEGELSGAPESNPLTEDVPYGVKFAEPVPFGVDRHVRQREGKKWSLGRERIHAGGSEQLYLHGIALPPEMTKQFLAHTLEKTKLTLLPKHSEFFGLHAVLGSQGKGVEFRKDPNKKRTDDAYVHYTKLTVSRPRTAVLGSVVDGKLVPYVPNYPYKRDGEDLRVLHLSKNWATNTFDPREILDQRLPLPETGPKKVAASSFYGRTLIPVFFLLMAFCFGLPALRALLKKDSGEPVPPEL